MNTRAIVKLTVFLALSCFSLAPAVLADGHNLLKDPGFEDRLSSDDGGWELFKESQFSNKQARSGKQSMFNWGYSRTVPYPPGFIGTVSGSFQEFPAAPGSKWRLTGYGIAPVKLDGGPAFGIVQISFFNEKGKDVGTVETIGNKVAKAKTSNEVNSESPAGEWILLDTGIATAPEGAATVQAFTLYVDFSGSNVAQGVFFDDLVLCEVENDEASACDND